MRTLQDCTASASLLLVPCSCSPNRGDLPVSFFSLEKRSLCYSLHDNDVEVEACEQYKNLINLYRLVYF